mmetsp:Transcript_8711/g.25092  ORF Transcript_8711/g.25092 Transcript_8711/m.25092 type:complete len:359 (-) Transcript_8711:227-1303(-)
MTSGSSFTGRGGSYDSISRPSTSTSDDGEAFSGSWPTMPSGKFNSTSTSWELPVTMKAADVRLDLRHSSKKFKRASTRPPTPVAIRRHESRATVNGDVSTRPLVARSAPEGFWAGSGAHYTATDDSFSFRPPLARSSSSVSSRSIYSHSSSSSLSEKKLAHFISGSGIMNAKAGSSVFQSKLVRMKSLKSYLRIFRGMKIDQDGTVPIEEFERHISQTAPTLVPHAQALYNSVCHKASPKHGIQSKGLNFQALLSALFPAATSTDIHELMEMVSKPSSSAKGPTKKEKADAQDIFEFWNTGNTGRLTYEEAEKGMSSMEMPQEEMEHSLDELFGEYGQRGFQEAIELKEFIGWFTGTA